MKNTHAPWYRNAQPFRHFLVFMLFGAYLPYLFGDRHDPSGQLWVGVFVGLIGIGVAYYTNWRSYKKKRNA